MPSKTLGLLFLASMLASAEVVEAQPYRFAHYWPLQTGNYWDLRDTAGVSTLLWSCFTPASPKTEWKGAVGIGAPGPGSYVHASNDGVTFSFQYPGGFENHLEMVNDGDSFRESDCISVMIRSWDVVKALLLPAELASLPTSSTQPNLLVWVWYDANSSPNAWSTAFQRGLPPTALSPTGGVTGLDWFQSGVGPVESWGVDACNGGVGMHSTLWGVLSDCDGDNVTDAAQIAANVLNNLSNPTVPLIDVNTNGVIDSCEVMIPPLLGNPLQLSPSGGVQAFTLDAGVAHAFKQYLLVGSISGTSVGPWVGALQVPLTLDPYSIFSATYPNTLPLSNSLNTLTNNGRGTATLFLPPGLPAAANVYHAYLVFNAQGGVDFVSNAVPLTIASPNCPTVPCGT